MATSKKSTSTKSPSKTSAKQHTGFSLKSLFMKLTVIVLVTLSVYTIYLDGKVRRVFEGQRWQMPIHIYGDIAELKLGGTLNANLFKKVLIEAGYQQVAIITRPGQFFHSGNNFVIQRRVVKQAGFDFPDAQIKLSIAQGHIVSLLVNQQAVEQVALEPYLLDKILPSNKEDRMVVSGNNIPQQLIDTLLLVEDKEFYQHIGLSFSGIARAFINNIRAGKTVQGGSTLTQQLVKNMFLTRDKTLWRKANEAIMALLLEFHYSKKQLLEAYINEVYLGQNYAHGVHGFGLGAEFYFDQPLQQLSPEKIALLVGTIKGPSYYNPWRFAKRSKARRDLILQLMLEHGLISIYDYEQGVEAPLAVREKKRLAKQKFPGYIQLVKQELGDYVDEQEQYTGLDVYTGFSLYSQKALETSVQVRMPQLEQKNQGKALQVAMVVTDIESGTINALVGDKDLGYAGFNRAIHAKRQIGSLIKPAVYLAALQQYKQFNLASVLEDKAITLKSDAGKVWKPKNYNGQYQGQVPLIDGLTYSLNIPTVNLGMQLGLDKVSSAMVQLGYQEPIVLRPSVLLGSVSMSPLEVSQFYLPIAGKGLLNKSHTIKQVIDGNNGEIWHHYPSYEQVVPTEVSYLLDYALTSVTTEGTARSLSWRLKDAVVAGKTGTTNEQRDSWFVGYDNKHLVTTWVGSDDNSPTALTGSSGALVLFSEFMKLQGVENKDFATPAGVVLSRFEQQTGNFVSDKCDNTFMLPAVVDGLVASPNCLAEKPTGIKAISKWFDNLFSE